MTKHASKPRAKPWIDQIHAYTPGKSSAADGRALIKLSANENPLGTSRAAMAALAEAREQAALYADPACTRLREALAQLHGLEADQIVCGTGSGELLHCAVQAFAGAGDEVLFSRYSFSLYPLIAHKVGATPVMAADADYAADVDALLGAVTPATRVVLLDNPNNPTATWIDPDAVRRLHAGLRGDILLVLDEAYAEYLPEAHQPVGFELARRHENVLVTRTFSKAYGLAAERIGWAYGAPHLIDYLNRLRGAFNVSASGQKAALAAVGDQEFVQRSAASNREARSRFVAQIEALGNRGLRALPSEANFVLVEFAGKLSAQSAMQALGDAGYAVRHLPGQGLPNHLRITIGTPHDMDVVAQTLSQAAGVSA
ncbi:MAG: histidinol-phosphate transaminase [Erythrobacter sp.]|uniref:pyridoxal phosphate-dependent aminotransferase n=1 Tax=Erythrobacter sp. TaxID=1042 RepID=UPI00261B4854|nr:histidinol-phosphate transaminase [Erythrobacter sp.]MDJ0979084.1 histidinol-phosphate transaminase [Erythrobacter sp.]